MHTSTSDDAVLADASTIESKGVNKNVDAEISSNGSTKIKRRKSLTQSIRARLSRQSSGESSRSSNAGTEPPVPSIPKSYSSSGSLSGSPSMSPSSGAALIADASKLCPSTISQEDLNAAWSSITPPAFPSPMLYTACYCEENVYLLLKHLSTQLAGINRAAANIARKQSAKAALNKRNVVPVANATPLLFVPVWDLHAIFVSNSSKTVLLYQQNASKLPNAGSPVIWDYHVIAAATCHLVPLHELTSNADGNLARPACFHGSELEWSKTWIYDSDSRLASSAAMPSVVPFDAYNEHTFRPAAIEAGIIPEHFQPQFRSVPATDFLNFFASDRSHMLASQQPLQDGKLGQVWNSPPPTWDLIVGAEAKKAAVSNNLMERYVDMTAFQDGEGRYGRIWSADTWLKQRSVATEDGLLGATLDEIQSDARDGSMASNPSYLAVSETAVLQHSLGVPSTCIENGDEKREEREEAGRIRGGRVASPLFPAYLHASQQHRSRPPPPPPPPSLPSSLSTVASAQTSTLT